MRGVEIPAELSGKELQIVVKRLADDLSYGEDNSAYLGAGVEYAQSRPFADGDAVKDIDWRVTARTGRVHVKQYEALRRMPIYLLVDTSASMAVSSVALSKHRMAVVVAGALGLAALRRQSPVGVLGAGERVVRFAPSLLKNRIFLWLDELAEPGLGEGTRLARCVDEAGALSKSKSLVIVLSDFHDEDAVAAVKRIATVHDCVALELMDPAERGRSRGFFRAREAETGRAFVAHGRSYWKARSVAGELKRAGIDHLLLATDRPFVTPLRRFLKDRGMLGRNAR